MKTQSLMHSRAKYIECATLYLQNKRKEAHAQCASAADKTRQDTKQYDTIRYTLSNVCVFVFLTFKLNAEKNYNFFASCILREQNKKKKKKT